jgi:histidinol dehydrogenase
MRIVQLTTKTQESLLASRRKRDTGADKIASTIIDDVRRRGDAALFFWTKRFDRVPLNQTNIWVTPEKFRKARASVAPEFLNAVDRAVRNIRMVAQRQKPQEWTVEVQPGVRTGQVVRPIHRAGCYIPGGRFSLASTLLMTVVPAQEAGVREIVVASPQPSDHLLAAADRLGVHAIARMGGAQAIAALAYGTRAIPRVDKIFGPGNAFVTAAKRLVSADCAIDLLAGPTEAVIFAARGNAQFIAADLIAQAEHDPKAISLFVTISSRMARAVAAEIDQQVSQLPESNLAKRSLAKNGAVLIARSVSDAARFINRFAPEHLSLPGITAGQVDQFDCAGSIFLGQWSAQAFGDYASGSNHVLPTGGVARARGGLSTADFVKCISVQEVSSAGLERLAPVVAEFAKAEGLVAHGRSVEVRK